MNLDLTIQEAEELYSELSSREFNLDLTRGKPHSDQLNLSRELENSLSGDYFYDGIDTVLFGNAFWPLTAARELSECLQNKRREGQPESVEHHRSQDDEEMQQSSGVKARKLLDKDQKPSGKDDDNWMHSFEHLNLNKQRWH